MPAAALAITCGCGKDPEVAKREYQQTAYRLSRRAEVCRSLAGIPERAPAGRTLPTGGRVLRLGDTKNAYREYVRAADLLPDDAEAQLKAAEMVFLGGQFEHAMALADKALTLDGRSVEAQIIRGNALAGLKNFEAAIAEMEQALALNPDRSVAFKSRNTRTGSRQSPGGPKPPSGRRLRLILRPCRRTSPSGTSYGRWAGPTRRSERSKRRWPSIRPMCWQTGPWRSSTSPRIALPTSEPFLLTIVKKSNTAAARLLLADYYVALARRADATDSHGADCRRRRADAGTTTTASRNRDGRRQARNRSGTCQAIGGRTSRTIWTSCCLKRPWRSR